MRRTQAESVEVLVLNGTGELGTEVSLEELGPRSLNQCSETPTRGFRRKIVFCSRPCPSSHALARLRFPSEILDGEDKPDDDRNSECQHVAPEARERGTVDH